MKGTYFLDPVRIIYGSEKISRKDAALIVNGVIKGFGEDARLIAKGIKLSPKPAREQVLAPCLVDPHSTLKNPIDGTIENIDLLKKNALRGGYGQVAILPKGSEWRDRPERLIHKKISKNDILIHEWGGFSLEGKGEELSSHAGLLEYGAIGLSENDSIPNLELIRKGLLLNELGESPLLLAPRDSKIQQDGLVRESVQALRDGWCPDPIASETLPLSQILELQRQHPDTSIRLMNLSTAEGVRMLSKSPIKTEASVCWWNLVADNSLLSPSDLGWRVCPSLGTAKDREALIKALFHETLTAVAVNSIALDESETTLPVNQQLPGLYGHHLVLPSLWEELVVKSNWSIEKLWDILSFGPSRMLKRPEESLEVGSNRWLLFDPKKSWIQAINREVQSCIANQPFEGKRIQGEIIDCGLTQ